MEPEKLIPLHGGYLFVPRSPADLDSSQMPKQARLYARWFGARGHVSAWSLPLTFNRA